MCYGAHSSSRALSWPVGITRWLEQKGIDTELPLPNHLGCTNMGVCNGPAMFQRLMQTTMNDLIFQIVLVYLDDTLVFSRTFSEHVERLRTVLSNITSYSPE